MKSKLNIILACSFISLTFFSHTFAFSSEFDTEMNVRSNLILKNIEKKLNELADGRNKYADKVSASDEMILKEIKKTNQYLIEVSVILKEYINNESKAHAADFQHMKIMEVEISNIKKLISNKQEEVSMK